MDGEGKVGWGGGLIREGEGKGGICSMMLILYILANVYKKSITWIQSLTNCLCGLFCNSITGRRRRVKFNETVACQRNLSETFAIVVVKST